MFIECESKQYCRILQLVMDDHTEYCLSDVEQDEPVSESDKVSPSQPADVAELCSKRRRIDVSIWVPVQSGDEIPHILR